MTANGTKAAKAAPKAKSKPEKPEKPAKPAKPEKQYGSSWLPGALGNLHDVTVPSGGVVQAKRIGPTELVKSGLLGKVDILSAIVQSEHIDRVAGRTEESETDPDSARNKALIEMMKDPTKLQEAFDMIDEITLMIIVQPKVHPIPMIEDPTGKVGPDGKPVMIEGERRDDRIYIDSIDEEDKMFLFQWTMGGSTDLESFREGLGKRMAALESLQDLQVPTK